MSHPSSQGRRSIDAGIGADPGRIKVGVGDLAVATGGETLTTSGLGSCVAVALVDDDVGVRGLLHAMLPTGDPARTAHVRPAKYVDTGIETLIEALREAGASTGRLEARVAGGAEMLDLTDAVGPRNVERAEQCLDRAGVPIVASDVGDGVGRTIRFRADGGFVVRAADGFERTL
ncbi:chemotaxis protein CheD [Halorubrum trueperi]|uniref:Probable chemoreceptor glutamine deamidase CheD n=1 Tax=Halorubrum trueperi TaxID=2004704 RepID=A0ABD5UKZ8_9EURY